MAIAEGKVGAKHQPIGTFAAPVWLSRQGLAGECPVQKRSLAIVALLLATMPALSQGEKVAAASESECADKFKAADTTNDGVLTVTEIPKAQQMPPALAKESLISRKEFMAACAKMPNAVKQ